jgi:hypothetical protein
MPFLIFSILFTRASSIDWSKARIWSNSACTFAVRVGSSAPEEAREAGLWLDQDFLKTNPPRALLNCLPCLRHDKRRTVLSA